MGRQWYEVRIRECLQSGRFLNGKWVDGKYVKKSRFYLVPTPQDAAAKYQGDGYIMGVEKVSKERLLGIGEFFTLGDSLLKEFSKGGDSLLEQVGSGKDKRRQRLHFKEKFRRG